MLKWVVTGNQRQSHYHDLSITKPSNNEDQVRTPKTCERRRSVNNLNVRSSTLKRPLRRKSSEIVFSTRRRKLITDVNKENNLTSTPLPSSDIVQLSSPLRKSKGRSLKDLSNITPTNPDFRSWTPQNYRAFDRLPFNSTLKNNLSHYASTLPTFDIEYSPSCAIVPGPLLALRGMGIADSYFDKPRYLTNDKADTIRRQPSKDDTSTYLSIKHKEVFSLPTKSVKSKPDQEDSLSSSRMGDLTLDRMIDAILESARKEKRPTKSKPAPVMSPSYTPAEDPASDLNEFWDPRSAQYLQHDQNHKYNQSYKGFNEREVKTPEYFETCNSTVVTNEKESICHLHRQRAVRRKPKNSFKTSMKCSAQKFFASNSLLRKNFEELVKMETPKAYLNLSPDSGRNSASDFEESTEDLKYTKRRLSFSTERIKGFNVPIG